MKTTLKAGDLCIIRISKNWKANPFAFNEKTKKQSDLNPEAVCLVLALSPHWDTPVSKLWARVLIGDTIWDIHTDFLEKISD
jgi:hypothetical protein